MINERFYNGIVWKDIDAPAPDEVREVALSLGVNEIIAKELTIPTPKPKVDLFKDYIYLVLHFPAVRHTHTESDQEVDFIIGKTFLITAHYDTVEKLSEFAKRVEVGSITKDESLGAHGGFIFYHLIKTIYGGMLDELESIKSRLERIEREIFVGQEMPMVEKISNVSRDLLIFKKSLKPHGETLELFKTAAIKMFGDEFSFAVRNIQNEYKKISDDVNSYIEILDSLRETNIMLISTKQNEVMKFIAIVAFLILPVTLVSSLLDIDAVYAGIIKVPYGLLGITILTVLSLIVIYNYAKHKKWF